MKFINKKFKDANAADPMVAKHNAAITGIVNALSVADKEIDFDTLRDGFSNAHKNELTDGVIHQILIDNDSDVEIVP